MGSFLFCIGDETIPKDRQQEFEKNILHILDVGGMMQFEPVELFGKKIHLMKPVEPDEKNGAYWTTFNYFEDDFWEDAGYLPSSHRVYSNKVGYLAFHNVMLLCHLMQELYTDGRCMVDGDIYKDLVTCTAWINREFGTTFDLDHRADLLHIYHVLQEDQDGWRAKPKNIDDLDDYQLDYKPSSVGSLMDAYIETHSVLETIRFFTSKHRGQSNRINFARWLYKATHAFVQKRRTSSQSVDEQVQEALSYRKWQDQHPYVEPPDNLKPFVYIALIPVETLFHVIAYAYPPLTCEEARERYGKYFDGYVPVLSMKDSDPDTRDNIQKAGCDLKNIVLCDSDDDRAYWWREDADFDLSEGFRKWMGGVRDEHRAICEKMVHGERSYEGQLRKLLDTLIYVNDTYHKLFMFRSSFYDILGTNSLESAAAVELLSRMAHRNEPAFREYERTTTSIWKELDHPRPRMEIKHYLALLGNRTLRKSVLSF